MGFHCKIQAGKTEGKISFLEKIAFFQNRRDEVPNQLLAKELVDTRNVDGIREIAVNLGNNNKNVRSDCLKVLYEIGYLDPALIANYWGDFLGLLKSKDNRMVWGALITLATIADRHPHEIWAQIDDVIHATVIGTVISKVWGIRALARVAAADPKYQKKIFPILLGQIQGCLPRDVPLHSESILFAVDQKNKGKLISIMEARRAELTSAQLTRYKKVLKALDAI
jgi:hypothetical protein